MTCYFIRLTLKISKISNNRKIERVENGKIMILGEGQGVLSTRKKILCKFLGLHLEFFLKQLLRNITFKSLLFAIKMNRLIEINGVLLAVLKYRLLQKRHRPPHDKTPGLSFDTAMYPHQYKNLRGNSR
jgi:hypothetical protein